MSGALEEQPLIQLLCDTCASAAAYGLQPKIMQQIMMCMDLMQPEDVGLHAPSRSPWATKTIRTQTIFENEQFEVVIFLFPSQANIPLHDHPGMSVFSKVLYGSLAMQSFDWEQPVSTADKKGSIVNAP